MTKWFSALWLKGLAGAMLAVLPFLGIAEAVPCAYDISPLPHIEGRVSRVTADGVMLMDGRLVILSETLLPVMRQGEDFVFYGLNAKADTIPSGNASKFWALALRPVDNIGKSKGNKEPELICSSSHEVQKGAYPGSPAYDLILTSLHHPSPDHTPQENKEAE